MLGQFSAKIPLMKRYLLAIAAVLILNVAAVAGTCAESAKIVPPTLTTETRKTYEAKLDEAKAQLAKAPGDADAFVWLGRRTAYLGQYREAIAIFARGIAKFPKDARFYRHRGHRYVTLRCFDDAIYDLEKAANLVQGKTDEIEPDGLPNAKNTPTGTLQTNIWYHLGLAYYLKGDFLQALEAYRECALVSKNNDMRVATAHWHYMTLRRLGLPAEAQKVVEPYGGEIEIIENADYLKLVKLYRGEPTGLELLKETSSEAKTLGGATLGYGVGNWYLYGGRKAKAREIFREITAGDQWASFGYIAAEAELRP